MILFLYFLLNFHCGHTIYKIVILNIFTKILIHSVSQVPFEYPCENKTACMADLKVGLDMSLDTAFVHDARDVIIVGSTRELTARVTVRNRATDMSIRTSISIKTGANAVYANTTTNDVTPGIVGVVCEPDTLYTTLSCTTPGAIGLRNNDRVYFNVSYDVSRDRLVPDGDIDAILPSVRLNVTAQSSESKDNNPGDNSVSKDIPVKLMANVIIKG
jgi:hypothetical protein